MQLTDFITIALLNAIVSLLVFIPTASKLNSIEDSIDSLDPPAEESTQQVTQ